MGNSQTVNDLRKGQSGIIKDLSDEQISLKLLEMGCVPGSSIRFEFAAPLGDPICVRVAGYHLTLRKAEAATIILESE